MSNVQGYCCKCRSSVTAQNPRQEEVKNGRQMYKGTCPKCGTTVCAFISNPKPKEEKKVKEPKEPKEEKKKVKQPK